MMLFLLVGPLRAVALSSLRSSVEEVIIKNGEFNEGLNHWIVSSPGENNPSLIVDSSGNHYVKATNGENILQYVELNPGATYRFAYYVIGDPNFPAVVEFGTLNHDQGYKPLKEEKHYDTVWKQHEFIFKTPEEKNTYIIRFASSGNGVAYFDNIQAAWIDLEIPSIPTNLRVADVTSDSVSLTWEASTDNIGVAGYRVYRDKQLIQEVQGETYTDSGLEEDREYTYKVSAVDGAGNESQTSDEVIARTSVADDEAPTPPLNLRADNVTTNSVSLTWEASTDNIGVTGYRIYRDKQLIQEVQGETYTDGALEEDREYTYKVSAVDGAGNESQASNEVQVKTEIMDEEPPTVPKNLRATTITKSKVTLIWEASSDNIGVSSYQVYRDHSLISVLSGDQSSYTDTQLSGNTRYYYTIRAADRAGNVSALSKPLLIITKESLPAPPVEEPDKETEPPTDPKFPQKENEGSSIVDTSTGNKTENTETSVGVPTKGQNHQENHLLEQQSSKTDQTSSKEVQEKLPSTGTQVNRRMEISGVGLVATSLLLFYIKTKNKKKQ